MSSASVAVCATAPGAEAARASAKRARAFIARRNSVVMRGSSSARKRSHSNSACLVNDPIVPRDVYGLRREPALGYDLPAQAGSRPEELHHRRSLVLEVLQPQVVPPASFELDRPPRSEEHTSE